MWFIAGRTQEEIEMEFETTVDIDAPPERIWATLVDVERWPEWTASITRVKRLTESPLAPGERTVIKQPGIPRLTWEVTELEPGQSFTWQARSRGVSTVGSHSLKPAANAHTTVTFGIHQSGVLAPIIELLNGKRTRRYVDMEVRGLKQRCEAG